MLGRLRAQAAAGIDVSQHAADEMDAEGITLDAVREVVATAILLEDDPTHGRGPCFLLYGGTVAGRPLHLVCTTTCPRLLLLRTAAPEMAAPDPKEATTMTCRITGCPGTYETKRRVRTIHHKGELLVMRNVPTEVCDVCGDAFFHEETMHHLEAMAHDPGTPIGSVSL